MKKHIYFILILFSTFSLQTISAFAQNMWTSRNAASGAVWRNLTYANGLYVAVANNGGTNGVMTSPDGITWTTRTTPSSATDDWNSITYGNGLFVAVGQEIAMSSPDGITWTERTPIAGNQWISVTYGNGLFVAVPYTASSQVMTSPDGITWTAQAAPTTNNLWSTITYANGLFVALASVGTDSRAMTSPDGINWTLRNVSSKFWHGITYGNGLFVAVAASTDSIMTSTDGITWTTRKSTVNNDWHGVTFGNGMFVAVGSDGIGNRVMSSPNGIDWITQSSASDLAWWSVCYGNGQFVALDRNTSGTTNRVMTSPLCPTTIGIDTQAHCESYTWINGTTYYDNNDTSKHILVNSLGCDSLVKLNLTINRPSDVQPYSCDGSNWLIQTTPASGWFSVAYGEGKFAALGINGIMTSLTGADWALQTSFTGVSWSAITYGNGIFVAVGITNNSVMISPDGVNWTLHTPAADYQWRSVVYGNGKFVAVASTGTGSRVMTSLDGITWALRPTPADNEWYGVTYGNGVFVAVANSGTGNRVMTSPDGFNWTIRNSAADNAWRSVTYGNGLFVATAFSGTGNRVMTSPDGINWTIRTSAADNGWRSVTYANGVFVAVASTGTNNRVMTSTDGINWTIGTSAADNGWNSVVFGKGKFVAVAVTGTGNSAMTSSCEAQATTQAITSCGDYTWVDGTTYTTNNSNATFTLLNSEGCDSLLVALDLTVNSVPTATISQNGNMLETGVFTSYQWLLNDAEINGANGQTYTTIQSGNYSVVATDANGCSDTSDVVNITTVGIDNLSPLSFRIYPNPNNGVFAISGLHNKAYDVIITDIVGRKVASFVSVKENQQIVLPELAAGIHFAHISTTDFRQTLTFSISK